MQRQQQNHRIIKNWTALFVVVVSAVALAVFVAVAVIGNDSGELEEKPGVVSVDTWDDSPEPGDTSNDSGEPATTEADTTDTAGTEP